MLVHPLGRGSPCPRRLSDRRAIGRLRHHRVRQGERREGRNRQVKHGTPPSADTDSDKPDQRPPTPTGQTTLTHTGHPGHRVAQADSPISPVSPAIRAVHPERFVVSRAARPLVPASTTGDPQAREFASFAACDAAPSLAIERRALFTFPVVVRGPCRAVNSVPHRGQGNIAMLVGAGKLVSSPRCRPAQTAAAP